MKITIFSNFLNHHQLPFCLEMQKALGDNFKFVATEKIPDDRIKLGYDDINSKYKFVIEAYKNEAEAYKLGIESDVVIIGSAPVKYIEERLKERKLIFRYSERIFKNGFNLRVWLSLIKNFTFKERKNVYLLCSSAYSAYDFNSAGAYINKCYKWGYFPEVKEYDLKKLMDKKNIVNKVINILWVGRIIPYKHPEKAIEIARRLKKDNIKFTMKIIGIGELFDEMKELVRKYNLQKEVKLLGSINNKEVRKYMEEANIYLFTSDYEEGWGAVLNEAMNSACAVVASHAIGAVPFLIKHNENGLIYNDDSIDDLYSKVYELVSDKNKLEKLGINAYDTMIKVWNAKYASKEFLKLSKKLLENKNKKNVSKFGPCSSAMPISNKKMFENLLVNTND